MTISKDMGKRLTALGFMGAAVLTFLSGICTTIYAGNVFSSFWPFCAGVFRELSFVCLLAGLLGLIANYFDGRDNMDLICAASLALSLLLYICSRNSVSMVWQVLSGIAACGYIGIYALRAKDSGNMIMLIGLACAAVYLIMGDWVMELIFVDGLHLYKFSIFITGLFNAVCYGVIGVYVFTAEK